MCNIPREVRAAVYGVRHETDDVPEDENPAAADDPVRHPVVHD
jgi:hypothetical protein